ncbi:MAG: tetratricopeptide repeat protein [Pseudomonadota bacterium]|nr:tetratricopeptide repeat protein [Pseudomonadota bacterium]
MKKRNKKLGRKLKGSKVRKKIIRTKSTQDLAVKPHTSNTGSQSNEEMVKASIAIESGQFHEAFRYCMHVLRSNPGNTEALNLAGVSAFQIGDFDQAISLLETAISFRSGFADAYNNLGNVRKSIGDFTDAEEAYKNAINCGSENTDAEFNLGILYELQGRFKDAEKCYLRCLELNPGMVSAIFNLGNVFKALGRLKESEAEYARVLKLEPTHVEALNNLGTIFTELNRKAEAIHVFRKAISLSPNFAESHYNLGIMLQESKDLDGAIVSYNRALDTDPQHVGAEVNIGYCRKELGELNAAEAAYLKAIKIMPDYDKAFVNLGDLYLHQGKPEKAIEICKEFLDKYPNNISVLAFLAIAQESVGNRDAVQELIDFNRFLFLKLHRESIEGMDIIELNQDFSNHVLEHPSLTLQPSSHATKFGRHSGELLIDPKGPISELEKMIFEAVSEYCLAIPIDTSHPWLSNRPKNLGLSVWGVAMEDQGFQLSHIHPSAWLSGVYYAKIPDTIREDDESHSGWIEFGRAPDNFSADIESEIKLIKPENGLMILFPSYFYHRTIPFVSNEVRISIAFDILDLETM